MNGALKYLRILALPTALMGFLIFYDIFFAPPHQDVARITRKYVTYGRGGGNYIQAKGDFSYSESVPVSFWNQCTAGDEIKLALTPCFKEWRHVSLLQNGKPVAESMGKDIWWMGMFGVCFLVPCIFFLPSIGETMSKNPFRATNDQGSWKYNLHNIWKLWFLALGFEMIALLLWLKFAFVLMGISPKM
jgi:hypothetical protein